MTMSPGDTFHAGIRVMRLIRACFRAENKSSLQNQRSGFSVFDDATGTWDRHDVVLE